MTVRTPALVALFLVANTAALAAEEPIVYALVIGIGKYEDAPLQHSVPDAKRFAKAIRGAYPGSKVEEFYDGTADLAAIRQALFTTIPSLPKQSVIIIYFSGHGHRLEHPSEHAKAELFLLLSGAQWNDYMGNSVRGAELLDSIYMTQQCTAMVFLDCCFAGAVQANDLRFPDDALDRVGVRAFVFAAAAEAELSEKGYFTEALLEVWKELRDSGADSITPRELEMKVHERVRQKTPFMHPKIVFGNQRDLRVAKLMEPAACLVGFYFLPGEVRYPCEFLFDGARDYPPFYPAQEIYVRQLPKRPVKVRIEIQDYFWEGTLNLQGEGDYVRCPVQLPEAYVRGTRAEAEARALAAMASAVENYGANPADEYFNAATAYVKAYPRGDARKLLAKAYEYAPDNPVYALVAATEEQLIERAGLSLGPDRAITTLATVGRYEAASMLAKHFADSSTEASKKDFFEFRAHVLARAANKKLDEGFVKLPDRFVIFLADVEKRAPEEVARDWPSLSPDYTQWLAAYDDGGDMESPRGLMVDARLPSYRGVEGLSGSIRSVGEDTMNNVITMWAEGLQAVYPNVRVEIEGKGSATAPPALIAGTADLGMIGRPLKSREIAEFEKTFGYKPVLLPIGIDMLAVYVHKDNPINGLTLEQVDAIFSRTRKGGYETDIRTWGDLGLTGEWEDKSIHLYGRNRASSTYGYFKEHALFRGDYKDEVKEQAGSSSVVQCVGGDKYGIGYSGIGYGTDDVRAVPLTADPKGKFVPATQDRLYTGEYPLSRSLFLVVNYKPGTQLDPLRREFIRYALSKEGQQDVVRDGYVPLPAPMAIEALKSVGLGRP